MNVSFCGNELFVLNDWNISICGLYMSEKTVQKMPLMIFVHKRHS